MLEEKLKKENLTVHLIWVFRN